ncbi:MULTISPECIES: PTS mannose/fructose/sorbose/N-acetylgalactosamine transporter subunit IIC [Liquorilactobacillus]|uniref:Phosphotransferase system, mannose fructose N-acetylgalactosamine-specific component IIC n=1 Tax=Liquorilactobacillus mali TaxID=1618 RepID=A0A0R2G3P7_9LACO|nr:PTS sugar transporter subunit IIC [Liquorilactobacillus mali]KRN32135.1 phosphotransferase system, mannose fructose N-acetylgalactosamine-specific component IIC [Liquorilactobacillus mali]
MHGNIIFWQVLLLTLYSMYQIWDELTIVSSLSQPVWAGLITGAIMGDVTKGLIIGGSLQLTVLGVGTFGGSSKIDANSGTILATAFSISTGMNASTAVAAIGVPVASLMIETDILGRFTNTFFQHRIDRLIDEENYSAIERNYLYGVFPWILSRGIPVFLALQFGGNFVSTAVKVLDTHLKWLSNGLATAGALLPAVGFAILLRYLPVKKHIAYLILGFTLTALFSTLYTNVQSLGTTMATVSKGFAGSFNSVSMVAIALIGLGFAINEYKRNTEKQKLTELVSSYKDSSQEKSNDSEDGEIYGDED